MESRTSKRGAPSSPGGTTSPENTVPTLTMHSVFSNRVGLYRTVSSMITDPSAPSPRLPPPQDPPGSTFSPLPRARKPLTELPHQKGLLRGPLCRHLPAPCLGRLRRGCYHSLCTHPRGCGPVEMLMNYSQSGPALLHAGQTGDSKGRSHCREEVIQVTRLGGDNLQMLPATV